MDTTVNSVDRFDARTMPSQAMNWLAVQCLCLWLSLLNPKLASLSQLNFSNNMIDYEFYTRLLHAAPATPQHTCKELPTIRVAAVPTNTLDWWTDERTDGSMDGWMDEQTDILVYEHKTHTIFHEMHRLIILIVSFDSSHQFSPAIVISCGY